MFSFGSQTCVTSDRHNGLEVTSNSCEVSLRPCATPLTCSLAGLNIQEPVVTWAEKCTGHKINVFSKQYTCRAIFFDPMIIKRATRRRCTQLRNTSDYTIVPILTKIWTCCQISTKLVTFLENSIRSSAVVTWRTTFLRTRRKRNFSDWTQVKGGGGGAEGGRAGQEITYFLTDSKVYYQVQKSVPQYPQSSPSGKDDTLGPGNDVTVMLCKKWRWVNDLWTGSDVTLNKDGGRPCVRLSHVNKYGGWPNYPSVAP